MLTDALRRPGRILMVGVVLAGVAFATPAAAHANQPWRPGGARRMASVPVRAATRPAPSDAQLAVAAHAAKPFVVPTPVWPSGTATVSLRPASSTGGGAANRIAVPGDAVRAGALPVTVASRDPGATAARSVSVRVASGDAADRAGVNGVLIGLSRVDGGRAASPVTVTLDYSRFAAAYGGGWADRLRLVALPDCALTTPAVPACRSQTPVAFTQDRAGQKLTGQVSTGMVLAAQATAGGSVGTYSATSLSPAGQWTAGAGAGDFTYSYPIKMPPAIGGAAPSVTLSYDSGSVDGRTSATNAQASLIGDGWDYTPGFIERSYQPCAQDGIANAVDLCWAGNQVQLSLGSHSSVLVRDDAHGTWKPQNDDGTQVIALTGVNNGAWQGEAWEVVTPDGTQYYFGQNYLPTTASTGTSTNSVWTQPVYCPKSTEPCYAKSTGTNSFAPTMAWRWNLSYVVDPHGNLQTYQWVPETNYYQRGYVQGNGVGTNTAYTRGGYLQSISYGYRLADAIAGAKPLDTVTFGVKERCLSGCATFDKAHAANWPDVPFDQICATQTGTCANYGTTYFSTKRLTSITTSVLVAGAQKTVDTYTLDQMFPAPQAGEVSSTSGVSAVNQGDGTVAVMWLNSIAHTGNDTIGGGADTPLPKTSFVAMETPNRVDGATTGAAALFRPRMDSITTETGAQIVVSYADPQCSRVNNTLPASPDSDTKNCFPQYWTPTDGSGPVLDWFNKPQVSQVTVNDLVGPAGWSQAQVTKYKYDGIAWHRDDSPLTPSGQRTWNQFRGYRTVTTTTGVASAVAVPTQTVTTYLQGMDGDHLASGATRSVTVPDTVGDSVTDSNWLAGQTLETLTLQGVGGTPVTKTVTGPATYTSTATEAQTNSMPALVSRMPVTTRQRRYGLLHGGTTYRSTETDTTYDASGRVVTSDAKGDGVPEVCTTTSYAQDTGRNMLTYPAQVRAVQGACGTTPTAANTVSDTRTFYDSSGTLGALPGAGDATKTDAVDSYNAGAAVYVTQKTTGYDGYGRVTSSTDADGHTTGTAYTTPGAAPDVVTTTNPMGWTSTVTLDPATGNTIASTDVNHELTSQTYDGLGRLTAVWTPLHSKAANDPADQKFAYTVGGAGAPSTTATSTLQDNGYYSVDVKIYDGSARVIQEQAPTKDGSYGRLLSDTHYNSLGQVVKVASPYADTTAKPSTTMVVPANDSVIPEETQTFYDGVGRTVKALTVAKGVNEWSTVTAYPGVDETDTTPPAGGTAMSVFTDALGRTSASWRYNTATPTGKAADAIVTGYTYTPSGKTATVTDNAGNAWRYTYDLHDRQTTLVDPGAGTSTTTYSAGGAVLSTTDGRGVQLTYAYDALSRKKGEYDTTGGAQPGAANQLAAWTYDTLAKGQPTAQIRYTNGAGDAAHTYTVATAGYTVKYQPTGTTVTIPSGEGALAGTYQVTDLYTDVLSLLNGTRYGTEAGLPQETVNYGYTATGLISSFGGTYTYLNNASYDQLGRILQTNFGINGTQLARTRQYDEPTGRLLQVTDQAQTLSSAVQSTRYAYNQAGSITAESTDRYGVAVADTQCFGYDRQNRLTQAWTDTAGITVTAATPSTPVAGLGACNDTAPTAGKVTGGPAPYWQTYSYDPLGDRTGATDHDTSVSGTAGDVTQTLTYNSVQPDAVQTVTTKQNGTSTTTAYGYDAAGNTRTRTGQSIGYDAEGHTQSVTNTATNTTSTYTYAADGTLLVQRDQAANQAILYLPFGEEVHLDTSTGATSGLRYYTASPDGVSVVRSSTGTVDYQLADTLGTATSTVDSTTLAITTRYQDPFGAPRGAAPASWPDQHGFLGKPQDASTGLTALGARQYDPVTGRFLSVDPVLQAGDNRQMNGYSYAADDPVNSSDPTGLDDWYNDPNENVQEYDGGIVGDQWWFDPKQNPVDRTPFKRDDWYFDPAENVPVTPPARTAKPPAQTAKPSVSALTPDYTSMGGSVCWAPAVIALCLGGNVTRTRDGNTYVGPSLGIGMEDKEFSWDVGGKVGVVNGATSDDDIDNFIAGPGLSAEACWGEGRVYCTTGVWGQPGQTGPGSFGEEAGYGYGGSGVQGDYSYDFPYQPYVVPQVPVTSDQPAMGFWRLAKWSVQTAINFWPAWL